MKIENQPLAHKLRPEKLEEFFGQEHIIGENMPLRIAIENNKISSMIFWGPPGSGKTTLAKLISVLTDSEFIFMSAVNTGKEDIQKTINKARLLQKKTILFLDEIHRFNKAQQDFLLPYVEDGTIILIGATTENPSFEVISALLSRLRVFTLKQLTEQELIKIINRALTHKKGFDSKVILSEENKKLITNLANGDARALLNILEMSISLSKKDEKGFIKIDKEIIEKSFQKKLRYDKQGEEHYNIISALHKSMRDSDIQASIYWTTRLIEGGEDPKYIIRRMIRFASEDIGNANPQALQVAVSAKQAVEFLGYPECDTVLIQCAVYLAQSEKSNKVYEAVNKAKKHVQETGNLPVPLNLRNPETKLMKNLGYGKDYKYAHDFKDAKVKQQHFPDKLKDKKPEYYKPSNQGYEEKIKKKIEKDKD